MLITMINFSKLHKSSEISNSFKFLSDTRDTHKVKLVGHLEKITKWGEKKALYYIYFG